MHFKGAAAVSMCYGTAATGLYSKQPAGAGLRPPWTEGGKGKYRDEPIVILGGSSSVGQYSELHFISPLETSYIRLRLHLAIQLAALSGFHPIITTASPRHTKYLEGIGATHVVDRSADVQSEIQALLTQAGGPLKVVYDAISDAETQNIGWELLAPGGQLVVVLNPKVDTGKYAEKNVVFAWMDARDAGKREWMESAFKALTQYLSDGSIKVGCPCNLREAYTQIFYSQTELKYFPAG